MAKKSKKPSVRNPVHFHMMQQKDCVAMKSEKDYDRRKSKQQLKRIYDGNY